MTQPSRRTTAAIAGATMGVYVLVMAGATAAIAEAAAACSTWPTCDGRWLVPLDDPRLLVAWGHRVVALLVGGLVIVAVAFGLRDATRRRVRAALVAALALYPIQVGLGAVTAVTETTTLLFGAHLAVGLAIFGGLLLALTWTLEPETDSHPTTPASSGPEASPSDTPYEPPSGTVARLRETVRAYVSLTKPRLMWLLCLVAAAGMALSAGESLSGRTVVATLAGGVLAIGASGTFNHVLERDVDRRMQRTSDRPLATDRVGVRNALVFGSVLALGSIGVFLSINLLAAVLGAAAIAYYSVIYTVVLKPNTVQNTVIGGIAGSFPAVIGAAAASNTIGAPALLLAAVIFLWTPAHFYNLALAYKEDYARGGFPMLPVVRGEATTRKHVLYYLGATLATSALLAAVGSLGPLYAGTSVVFGGVFLWLVLRLHRERSRTAALRSFHASNAYLGALLVAIVIDAAPV